MILYSDYFITSPRSCDPSIGIHRGFKSWLGREECTGRMRFNQSHLLKNRQLKLDKLNRLLKNSIFVIPRRAARRGISLFLRFNQREIPRFARNDKIKYFFRSL
jgi:hypothetical protein